MMNGPVDNHRLTCLACHGRAVDFGRYEEDWLRYIPFTAAGFVFDPQQSAAFVSLQAAMASGLEFDQAALVRAQRLFTHVMKELKPNDFRVDPEGDDPGDIH